MTQLARTDGGKDRVYMVLPRRTFVTVAEPDSYRIVPAGRWARIARMLFWLLRKTGAVQQHFVQEERIIQIDLRDNRPMEAIFKAYEELFRRGGQRPSRVLIGAEDMCQLMRDDSWRQVGQPLNFTGQLGYGWQVMGLDVEVVPHMRGVLVL